MIAVVCRLFGWLVGWLVGWSVGRSVGRLVGRSPLYFENGKNEERKEDMCRTIWAWARGVARGGPVGPGPPIIFAGGGGLLNFLEFF